MAENRCVDPKAFFGELTQRDVSEIAFCYGFADWTTDTAWKKKLTESCG
jgi:hypothetical protein